MTLLLMMMLKSSNPAFIQCAHTASPLSDEGHHLNLGLVRAIRLHNGWVGANWARLQTFLVIAHRRCVITRFLSQFQNQAALARVGLNYKY
jgi:hypothetical protein